MKIIVVHDRYRNEPIIIRVDAIIAIKKEIDGEYDSNDEYSILFVPQSFFEIKEPINVVMTKIKKAESEDKE